MPAVIVGGLIGAAIGYGLGAVLSTIIRSFQARREKSNPPTDSTPSYSVSGLYRAIPNGPHPLQWAVDGPPIGVWSTENGTADMLMHDNYVFYPDGTGMYREWSQSRGYDTCGFLWYQPEPGTLRVMPFDYDSYVPVEPEDGEFDPSLKKNWQTWHYKTDWTGIDVGGYVPALKQHRFNADTETWDDSKWFGLSVMDHICFTAPIIDDRGEQFVFDPVPPELAAIPDKD